jgi:hypothetical protein
MLTEFEGENIYYNASELIDKKRFFLKALIYIFDK